MRSGMAQQSVRITFADRTDYSVWRFFNGRRCEAIRGRRCEAMRALRCAPRRGYPYVHVLRRQSAALRRKLMPEK